MYIHYKEKHVLIYIYMCYKEIIYMVFQCYQETNSYLPIQETNSYRCSASRNDAP